MYRTTAEVISDHLERAKHGNVEDDLARNYAADVTVFIADGVHHGHDGVRALADRLAEELPDAMFEYPTVLVDGEVAFLEWTGEAGRARVRDGADTFVVRDGKIMAQSIHYTVETTRDDDDIDS